MPDISIDITYDDEEGEWFAAIMEDRDTGMCGVFNASGKNRAKIVSAVTKYLLEAYTR